MILLDVEASVRAAQWVTWSSSRTVLRRQRCALGPDARKGIQLDFGLFQQRCLASREFSSGCA